MQKFIIPALLIATLSPVTTMAGEKNDESLANKHRLAGVLSFNTQENTVLRLPEVDNSELQKTYTDNNRGFWIAAEAGGAYSCRINHSNFTATEITVTGGYRFNEYLRVGVGVGGRYYINNDKVRHDHIDWAFPIFANVRGNIIPTCYRNMVPYYSFDIGGTVRDGFMIRPAVGIRVGQPRNAFILSLGYMLQMSEVNVSDLNGKDKAISFVSLRLGYEF